MPDQEQAAASYARSSGTASKPSTPSPTSPTTHAQPPAKQDRKYSGWSISDSVPHPWGRSTLASGLRKQGSGSELVHRGCLFVRAYHQPYCVGSGQRQGSISEF